MTSSPNKCLFNALFIIFSLISISLKAQKNDSLSPSSVYRFEKGGHFSKPRQLFSRIATRADTFTWRCRFDTSCCYFMRDTAGKWHEDQWDFNKLLGISFHFTSPHINTAMVGWRHHPTRQCFELVPYWHLNRQRYFREKNFVEVAPNETFEVAIITKNEQKEVTIVIKTKRGAFTESQTMGSVGNRVMLINPYFGGTSPAPRAMKLHCERLK